MTSGLLLRLRLTNEHLFVPSADLCTRYSRCKMWLPLRLGASFLPFLLPYFAFLGNYSISNIPCYPYGHCPLNLCTLGNNSLLKEVSPWWCLWLASVLLFLVPGCNALIILACAWIVCALRLCYRWCCIILSLVSLWCCDVPCQYPEFCSAASPLI